MDLDKALVRSIVKDGKEAILKAKERGIQGEYLEGEGRVALEFVFDYMQKYDSAPSLDVVEARTGILLPDVSDTYQFFVDEILNRQLYKVVKVGLSDCVSLIEKGKPKEAYLKMEEAVRAARSQQAVESKVELLTPLFQDAWKYYLDIKSGKRGILTPWAGVNDATFGFWPEDLAIFVARTGVGKTWVTLLLAREAWVAGYKILYVTTEVSRLRIASRMACIHMKISYKRFTKGMLTAFEEQRFKEQADALMNDDKLFIVGGQFDFRVESVEAAIDEAQPSMVLLDGAYLLKAQGDNRFERAANAFDEIKRLGKRKAIPTIVTTQFNREVKKNVASSVKTESIALTDVAGWNADLIYGLIQTEDMKRDGKLILKPLKVREGEGEETEVNWDLENMDFSQVAGSGPQGDADEFGTGLDMPTDPTPGGAASTPANDEVPF